MTRQEAAQQLAAWLASQHPDLFLALYNTAKFGSAPNTRGLGDISDWLSTIGDSISSAVSSVGNWLTDSKNVSSLATLASTYLQTQAQKQVISAQMSRLQANQAPLAVSYTSTGVPMLPVTVAGTPVIAAPTQTRPQVAGYVPATSSVLARFSGGGGFDWNLYAPWLLGIGGAVVVFLLMRRI